MSNRIIDSKILGDVLYGADDEFINEINDEINEIIDNELLKPNEEINEQLIDDCVNALMIISGSAVLSEVSDSAKKFTDSIIKTVAIKKRKQRTAAAVCACVATVTVFGMMIPGHNGKSLLVNAGNDILNAFKGTEKVETTSNYETSVPATLPKATEPGTTERVSEKVSESSTDDNAVYTSETPTTSAKTTAPAVLTVKQLYGEFSDDFMTEYESADKISLKGLTVKAVLYDGSEINVALSACRVTYSRADSKNRVRVKITYKGKSFSFYIRVVPNEVKNPVVLNSIYGEFDGAYSVDKMTVYAVYSDGSKKEIPISKCKITSGYDKDFGGVRVVVSYGGCEFGFMTDESEN